MLFKLMAMFTAVILLCVLLMLFVFALSSREAQIQSRIKALKSQAYDIAYLAGAPARTVLLPANEVTQQMLARKVRAVYEEFSAFCLVVDRSGRMSSNFSSVLQEHQELASTFDPRGIVDTLYRVLGGEEVVAQTEGEDGPMFTVAVPWVQSGAVLGAVYIQTAAQSVRAAYETIWKQAAVAALAAFLVAAAIATFYTRRMMKPLETIAHSAGLMARGIAAPPVNEGGARELKDLSASFNRMSRQIQETEETRRTFIANLSHELRSPMTSIQGFIQGLLDGTVKPEDSRQSLTIVLEETRRLNRLISGLMNLSRAEAPDSELKKTVFNLCETVRLVLITKISAIEGKGIEMRTEFEQEDMYALAARDGIEQVLINLLDNAIRFTPEGGQITLSIAEKDRKTLAVTVRDNGIGVLSEDEEKIFERFYTSRQAHSAGDGAGLGLAICRTILQKHGQDIRLLKDGPGAAFEFTLEKAEKPNGRAAHAD